MALELALEQWRPDRFHRAAPTGSGHPVERSAACQAAPVFLALEIKHGQTGANPAQKITRRKLEQVQRRLEGMDFSIAENTDRTFAPYQFFLQAEFPDQVQNRGVGEKKMMVGLFQR